MKNKKGFTLIELLAVIVILAIIALIVTPVVSNIVANARIASNARSVEGHIRNIELAIITKAFGENSTGDLDSFDTITSGATIESSLSRPGNDNVTCTSYTIKHGTVLSASGCKDNENKWSKTYTYSNSEGAVVFEFKGTFVAAQAGETHKGIVYMNPTDVKAVCNGTSTITTTADGCKKFYIYDDSGSTYKMINDRNLGANIEYNSANTNTAPSAAFTEAFTTRTAKWIGNPRLISADEVAAITGAKDAIAWSSTKYYKDTPSDSEISSYSGWFYLDGKYNSTISEPPSTYSSTNGWQKQYSSSTVKSNYAWLFDYTSSCMGCNNIALVSTWGYWTLTKKTGSISQLWQVRARGNIIASNAYDSDYGIRPVIEIPKSLIG